MPRKAQAIALNAERNLRNCAALNVLFCVSGLHQINNILIYYKNDHLKTKPRKSTTTILSSTSANLRFWWFFSEDMLDCPQKLSITQDFSCSGIELRGRFKSVERSR